jgi:hypothetical protein
MAEAGEIERKDTSGFALRCPLHRCEQQPLREERLLSILCMEEL